MKNQMKRFIALTFVTLLSVMPSAFAAGFAETCMEKISANHETFTDILYSEIIPADTEINQNLVSQNKPKILGLLAGNVLMNCMSELMFITDTDRTKISFTKDGKKYAFDFSIPEMFEYINLRTGIMVYNNRSLQPGDVIKLTDVPKLYWSDECSDHSIWDGVDKKSAINVVGKKVFTQWGGNDDKYFLDFEKGNNRRAFPGLVLHAKKGTKREEIGTYTNIIQAKKSAQEFAEALRNTTCSNQNLAVYVVALDTFADTTNKDKTAYVIGASVVGGTMALLGIGAGLATTTAAAATGSMLVVNSILGTAAAASSVPVVGWIVAGVLAAGAGVYALAPSTIEDMQQVMVLAGPYNI